VLDPKGTLNRLKNDKISKLKRYEQEGSEDCRETALGICRQIRECVERSIEKYLFNGIVERFCSDIQTRKLPSLKHLTDSDFDFIDKYMTKYSCYVHAVAEETPLIVPEAVELDSDIDEILAWIDNIKKRMK